MGNKIKTIYGNTKLIIESFKPETGVFLLTVGFWQSVSEYSEKWKRNVLKTKPFSRGLYGDTSIIVWTSHLQDGAIARWERTGMNIFYQEFQVTFKFLNPTIVKANNRGYDINGLKTFKANLETIKPDVEKFIDDVFNMEDAPTPYAKKKEADKSTSYVARAGFEPATTTL